MRSGWHWSKAKKASGVPEVGTVSTLMPVSLFWALNSKTVTTMAMPLISMDTFGGGEFDFCVHPETNFDMPGDERCQGHVEGTESRGFFEIDTGDALQFTHELSGLQDRTPVATSGDLWPYNADKLAAAWARQDYEAVLVRVQPAAVAGRAWALNILGLMHLYGYGVPRDHDLGAAWIRRAAERGWGKAQYNLARLLYESPQGKAEMGQVVYWLRQAAAQGVVAAQQSLAAIQPSSAN